MGTLQIDILGTSFAIQAKEDTAYLENLLAYYKQVSEQIEKNTGLSDPIKQAILTGIMLCDELYKEKKKNSETLGKPTNDDLFEAEKLTLKMIEKISTVL
ncbi:MAG: cell division protein ZapA [Spirochaetaceae bacterium]|jgi:cell division protein ZapA|nr:cell division protein ZapA [Spirochaetaceae bacterium]MBO4706459.1 cell division protein ZapA [Spirochaetaceae bacterium]